MITLLDCDGVLADFATAALAAHGRSETYQDVTAWDIEEMIGVTPEEFWAKLRGYDFWRFDIQPHEWAHDFLKKLKGDIVISTSPSLDSYCVAGKLDWLKHHFGITTKDVMVGPKKHLMAQSGHLLIDDRPKNVEKFINADISAEAILFPQPWNANADINKDLPADWIYTPETWKQVVKIQNQLVKEGART